MDMVTNLQQQLHDRTMDLERLSEAFAESIRHNNELRSQNAHLRTVNDNHAFLRHWLSFCFGAAFAAVGLMLNFAWWGWLMLAFIMLVTNGRLVSWGPKVPDVLQPQTKLERLVADPNASVFDIVQEAEAAAEQKNLPHG